MSIENVREYFKQFHREGDILEFDTSSATVALAAEALGVIPARIAKTLAFKYNDKCIVISVAGDGKIDNKKFKTEFGLKSKMLTPEETLILTGHPVGGVCPFDIPNGMKICTDISLKRFETVFPACGSGNSAIELTCDELFNFSKAEKWVDICKDWE